MKKRLLCLLLICAMFPISVAYAENGFYRQPYPRGGTPTSEPDENGFYEVTTTDGDTYWTELQQQELLPQATIEFVPTTDLVKSIIAQDMWKYDTLQYPKDLFEDIEICKYAYNSFYELLRRRDMTEALLEVYADDEAVPPYTDENRFLEGVAVETLLVIDQVEHGVFSDVETARLDNLIAIKMEHSEEPHKGILERLFPHSVPSMPSPAYGGVPGQRYRSLMDVANNGLLDPKKPIPHDLQYMKEDIIYFSKKFICTFWL